MPLLMRIQMAIQFFIKQQKVNIEFIQFSGGERHVQLSSQLLDALGDTVRVRAELNTSDDILDYLLLENVLIQHRKNIEVEIPYFPYARQDRVCATGQAFSLDVFCHLLNINIEKHTSIRRKITLWDAHSNVIGQLLNRYPSHLDLYQVEPVEIIKTSPALTELLQQQHTVLVCPDRGAKARTAAIAQYFNQNRSQQIAIIHCDKTREPTTGKITSSVVKTGSLAGKTAVITDDICDGGATFIGIAKELRKLQCEHIILYVTHGIFSRGLAVFDGLIDQIFTSNSRPQQFHKNLNVIEFTAI